MKMNIQTTVHLLPLPFELAETINGFLFRSYKSIQQEIIQKIKLGFSRATLTQYGLTESDFDNDHWFFQAYGENEFQFQAINCCVCGNYLDTNTPINNYDIICYCEWLE
jgi:hypothetical protein